MLEVILEVESYFIDIQEEIRYFWYDTGNCSKLRAYLVLCVFVRSLK